ncbi:MAG: hypothetical protein Kow0077_21220 [Anaerolineae bacterium]
MHRSILGVVGCILLVCALWAGVALAQDGGTPVVFRDDFSADTGNWSTGARDSGLRAIEGGQLRITDFDARGTTGSYLVEEFVFGDLEIELDTTLLSGDDRGWHLVLLHYQDSDNYHGFAFTAAGRVYGFTVLAGERTVWQESTTFPAVHTGFGQVNRVRALIDGSTVQFYINGALVTEATPPELPPGRVGVSVSAPSGEHANGPTEVAFDNVVIHATMPADSFKGVGVAQVDSSPGRLEVSVGYENALQALLEPGTFRDFEDKDGDGAPDAYSFLMPIEEPIPGVVLHQAIAIDVTNQTGAVVLSTTNSTGVNRQFSYTLVIPKAFAAHVDELTINPPPTAIVDPDPVVVLGISSDPESPASTVITVNEVRHGGNSLNDLANTFLAFQYERVRQFCEETERDPNRIRCFLSLAEHFPNHVTETDCDDIAATLDEIGRPDRDDLFLTCRAILTRDIWECSRVEHVGDRSTCERKLGDAMERRCLYLTGEAETVCQQEAASVMQAGTLAQGESTGSGGGGTAVQVEGPVREGYYHVTGTTWGTLHDGTESNDWYGSLKVCDGGERIDYVAATDPEHIDELCVRTDQWSGFFWQVTPGVYEASNENGVARLTVESPTRLHYYKEGDYNGYSSFTENTFEWYGPFP